MIESLEIKIQCAVCPTRIWEVSGMRLKKTPEYHEIDVRLNNSSKMTVGVCSQHLKPKKLELAMMTEKIHQGWLEELAFGLGNEEWVRTEGTILKVTGVQ